ncbi:MFS transporter [Ralstonia pseudosolanacearum]|uniref:MFS transporter n=1 Tax=Ralstonia pseudosolanacearum TaxID=1310165 RepID=UPI0009B5A602|nr:MFS transporter [Ralstonia pseudosolanacearum]AST29482.1 MFS transporter [Ralstonia pseudosolanacearum]MDC6283427.1 MFS transporter [Ralstonia pseudosolanacearum]
MTQPVSTPTPGPAGTAPPPSAPPPSAPPPAFGVRLAAGLLGVLLAAILSGLNNRVPGLALADVQGALGFAQDDASWLNTAYAAGELAAMPFATWFAVTFSMRRFHLAMLAGALVLSAILPFVQSLSLLLALRALQGLLSGALIPMLMMSALRFLPPPIRLHGLALYAMTATFAPNVALWLAALCVDRLEDWRWVYWQAIPLGLVAMGLVAWGVPKMPPALSRLKQGNWLGMALGVPGLALVVAGLDQGVRLDWFHSPLIVAALGVGIVLTALFLASEWRHPAPFMQLQMLGRRNLGVGFSVFVCLLMTMATAVTLPASLLGRLQGFRMEQMASIGLIVGLPQLVLGPAVALLLYQRWVDARHVFAAGLACIAAACWLGAGITSEWMVPQFMWAEILQAIGQPMAVIALLFLATSVVQPMEGPSVAGIVNTFRAFSSVLGGALIGQLTTVRSHFHADMLLDHAGHLLPRLPPSDPGALTLAAMVAQQAGVLAAADVYRVFGWLALLLIPIVLKLQYIPAPAQTRTPQATPPAGTQTGTAH